MLPEKFLERMQDMLGEEYPQFLQSYDREEYHTLRVNTLKSSSESLKQQMPFLSERVAWNPDGFYYSAEKSSGLPRPGRHPYHDAGVYYIQEASAMAPVVYLEPRPGEKILDLCAAPGGKSTQIGTAMENRGILVCNEIHPARAKILSENIERMGICNAIVTNETPQRLMTAFPEYFDRILVDAPCSGEGMFRKNEDACDEWSPENVTLCANRQDEILDCAVTMLKPGGRLVYSTCTFAPAENEGTISRLLDRHPEFVVETVPKFPGIVKGPDNTLRLWPHKVKGEGHYVAVLQKTELLSENGCETDFNTKSGKTRHSISLQKGIREKECREYLEFRDENIKETPKGILIKFGDQLYLAPEETPALDGLRVLRPGLHLGTIKKNRFEPSHALALALKPQDIRRTWNLSSDSGQIMEYLQGQTITADGEKGWYLITVDGYGIGWGKLSGNVMKNHYPKGLRK